MTYTVFVDDNFHYMDKDERYTHGLFETLEAAVEAAKKTRPIANSGHWKRRANATRSAGQRP